MSNCAFGIESSSFLRFTHKEAAKLPPALSPPIDTRFEFIPKSEELSLIKDNSSDLGINSNRVSIGGDSAGGNLAASLCVKRKKEELSMPKAQLLIYPVTDLTLKHPSIDEMAEGFFLTKDSMEYFRDNYLKDKELVKDPLVSPLFSDDLSSHPPAVATAGG